MNFFEKIIEWIFMARLALSPVLVGVIVGGYFYLSAEGITGEMIGIAIAVAGLIAGIILVIRVKRRKTAVEFLSRVNASPELDKKPEEK